MLTTDPDALALVVAGVGVELKGERVPELRPVPDHVPEHRTVLDLDSPVAGLEVRPGVRADVAHEAIDAVELALHLAHRVLSSVDPIEWKRPAALIDERTSGHRPEAESGSAPNAGDVETLRLTRLSTGREACPGRPSERPGGGRQRAGRGVEHVDKSADFSPPVDDTPTRYGVCADVGTLDIVGVEPDASCGWPDQRGTSMSQRTLYRSAVTGRIVTARYAKAHPRTTVRETVKGKR
ncbi:hypothetical protein [Clavibacter michiganensis]|uniref:hypothetical protein n=1 Tax=Clavibacter michiganensis TaxID=28447 RepID=UPI003DA00536